MTITVSSFCCSASRGPTHAVGIPRDLRQRLRQFLQPAVVRESSVPDRRIGAEDDFQAAGRAGREVEVRGPGSRHRSVLWHRLAAPLGPRARGRSSLGHEPIVQRVFPEAVEVRERLTVCVGDRPAADLATVRPRPVVLHEVVARLADLRVDERRRAPRRSCGLRRVAQSTAARSSRCRRRRARRSSSRARAPPAGSSGST